MEAETKATFGPSQNKPTPPWTSNLPHPQLPRADLPGAKNKDTLHISQGNLCFQGLKTYFANDISHALVKWAQARRGLSPKGDSILRRKIF